MGTRFLEKRNITPEQAVRVLRKNGIEVSEKDARKILDFMYIIAKLAIREHFSEDMKP
jgi:hypothetical protein